jgi:PKD repeat protein
MLKRYLSSSLLTALLLCFVASGLMASNANAQESRPDGLYIRAKVGANSYAGDRDFNPDNQFGDFFGTDEEENDDINKNPNTSGEGGPASTVDSEGDLSQISFPSVGGEIGYNAKFGFFNGGLALTYVGGKYTDLINANFSGETLSTQNDSPVYVVSEESSEWRHTVGLIGRVGFGGNATVQPYLQLGAQGTFGTVYPITNGAPGDEDDSEWELTFGPMAGIGLDFALTPRLGLFLEATGSGTFPDGNIDLHPGLDEDENGFDLLGFYGGGLRYSFGSVFTPVEIVSLDCPAELQAGESGTFTATINEGEATTPISSRWEFGDGTTDTGLVSTKTYNSAGTYTVTFTTSNNGASATRNCTVEVVEPPQPAVVASIDSNPNPSEPGESVSFTSNVRGDRPIDCEWDFGDGETSSNCNPTHTYEEPGSYNVTFTASNEYGSDTASLTQVVEQPQQLADICTNVTEFNVAFFERNSSTLSAEARDALSENLSVLERCPNLCVDVEGFASRAERDSDELSEARADAVAEYYEDNGIDSDRIDAEGMGARGQTTKKGSNAQFRRADSIPESCGPDGENTDNDPAVGSDPDFDEEDMMEDDMDM